MSIQNFYLNKFVSLRHLFNNYKLNSQLILKRNLNLYEYQSKNLLRQNGITIQKFVTIENSDEINKILNNENSELFNCKEYVIKAQVLTGGRGEGYFLNSKMKGGVKLTKNKDEVTKIVSNMINDYLITHQTNEKGILVNKVMVAEALDINKEFYLAILLDRNTGGPLLVASEQGGVNIEEIAIKDPDAIKKYPLLLNKDNSINKTLLETIAREALGLKDVSLIKNLSKEIERLFDFFIKIDAIQVEINPLGITPENKFVCFDAKIQFDENAYFRQKWVEEIVKENIEKNESEILAKKYNLNFVPMDGNIGCLVNGAGLAMATMDIIHLYGQKPANFLDIGGSVNDQGVLNAFKLITKDKNVKTILVNIFGGIVNCELVANGLVNALQMIDVPLVVRLEGTNEKQAKKILNKYKNKVFSVDNLEDAAKLVVQFANRN